MTFLINFLIKISKYNNDLAEMMLNDMFRFNDPNNYLKHILKKYKKEIEELKEKEELIKFLDEQEKNFIRGLENAR